MVDKTMVVEVAYALPHKQKILSLTVNEGTTVRVLNSGERVEIYRPLIADPKEVRKQRAAKNKAAKEA